MTDTSGRFAITPARAVEDQRLGDAPYRVLACLGTYANKDGWCWPSTSVLARRLGIARQSAQRSLGQLAQFGYIEIEPRRRTDGGHDRNRYRLLFDRALFQVQNREDLDEGMQHDAASPMQRGWGEACSVDAISPTPPYAISPTPPYIAKRTHRNEHGRSDNRLNDSANQFEQ